MDNVKKCISEDILYEHNMYVVERLQRMTEKPAAGERKREKEQKHK